PRRLAPVTKWPASSASRSKNDESRGVKRRRTGCSVTVGSWLLHNPGTNIYSLGQESGRYPTQGRVIYTTLPSIGRISSELIKKSQGLVRPNGLIRLTCLLCHSYPHPAAPRRG